MRIELLRASVTVALLGVAPSLALAQFMPGQIGGGGAPFGGTKSPPPAPKVAPPPALPGAASSGGAVPASRAPTDMEPTEALFDAINRGDIGTARDAISRGADLHGHNVLGMTPLELSVDLGRNDISFMLLSMRAADDGRPAQASATPAADEAAPGEAGQTGARASGGEGHRIGAGTRADRPAVQRRWRRAEPECGLSGVRFQPALMSGSSSG